VEPLIDRLVDRNARMRAAVLRALAFQERDTFWFLLSGLDPDPEWSVRAALAQLFGDMGDDRATSLLLEMISDRDFRVRAQVLRALARANSQTAIPVLLEHLGAEDPFERAAAAEGLGRLKPEDTVESLRVAFDFSARDQEPDARLAILSALESYGAESLEPTARLALDDPSWNVRKRAQDMLRAMGDVTAQAMPLDSGRSITEYRNLIHPQYTPQAFIRTEMGAIEVELFILDAPLTVENFMRLARQGFYNGLSFDHVAPNEWVGTGDPRGDSHGGPGYTIRSEPNTRPFLRGTLGMVENGKDTGGSQFFITYFPQPQLEGRTTVFGQVINGLNVLDRLQPGDVIREIAIWDGITAPDAPSSADSPRP
jgi:cyclophilin family peptidyl-prolyl cis-trans isomerase